MHKHGHQASTALQARLPTKRPYKRAVGVGDGARHAGELPRLTARNKLEYLASLMGLAARLSSHPTMRPNCSVTGGIEGLRFPQFPIAGKSDYHWRKRLALITPSEERLEITQEPGCKRAQSVELRLMKSVAAESLVRRAATTGSARHLLQGCRIGWWNLPASSNSTGSDPYF